MIGLKDLPLDTWMVVEQQPRADVRLVSTHASQQEAEAERDRRNKGLREPRYSVFIAFQPVAERMSRFQ